MDQPDFRALCAQLLAATQLYTGLNPAASEMSSVEKTKKLMDAMAVTTAALVTPPPEPPTDEELLRLYGVATPCYHVEEYKRELDFARATLKRWGR